MPRMNINPLNVLNVQDLYIEWINIHVGHSDCAVWSEQATYLITHSHCLEMNCVVKKHKFNGPLYDSNCVF